MAITVRLDVVLALRKVKGLRFSTLDAICAYLGCQPGDLLEHRPDTENTRPGP